MIGADAFRAMALSLPKVIEKPHFDRTSFRVDAPKGKILATAPADFATCNLKLSRDDQEMLCAAEPKLFAPVAGKWGEMGYTTLNLGACDPVTLASALQIAWKSAAPQKLHVQLNAAGDLPCEKE